MNINNTYSKRLRISVSASPASASLLEVFDSHNDSSLGQYNSVVSSASTPQNAAAAASRAHKIAYPHQAFRIFDNLIRSQVLELTGTNNRILLPAQAKQILNLKARYLCLQINVPNSISSLWTLEILYSDSSQATKKLVITPRVQYVQKNSNNTLLLPASAIPTNQWITLHIDMYSFTQASQQINQSMDFQSTPKRSTSSINQSPNIKFHVKQLGNLFRAIEGISISSPCAIRRIFGLNSNLDEIKTHSTQAFKQQLEIINQMQLEQFPLKCISLGYLIAHQKKFLREFDTLQPQKSIHSNTPMYSSQGMSPTSKIIPTRVNNNTSPPRANSRCLETRGSQTSSISSNEKVFTPIRVLRSQQNKVALSLADYIIPQTRKERKSAIGMLSVNSSKDTIDDLSFFPTVHSQTLKPLRRKKFSDLDQSSISITSEMRTDFSDFETPSRKHHKQQQQALKKRDFPFNKPVIIRDYFENDQAIFNSIDLSGSSTRYDKAKDNRRNNISPFSFLSHTKQHLIGFISLDPDGAYPLNNNDSSQYNTASGNVTPHRLQNISQTTVESRKPRKEGEKVESDGEHSHHTNQSITQSSEMLGSTTILSSVHSVMLPQQSSTSNNSHDEIKCATNVNHHVKRKRVNLSMNAKKVRSTCYAVDDNGQSSDSNSSIPSVNQYIIRKSINRYEHHPNQNVPRNRVQSFDSRKIFETLPNNKLLFPRRESRRNSNAFSAQLQDESSQSEHATPIVDSGRNHHHQNYKNPQSILPFKPGVLQILQGQNESNSFLDDPAQSVITVEEQSILETPQKLEKLKQHDSSSLPQSSNKKENASIELTDYLGISSKYSTINDPRFLHIENFMGSDIVAPSSSSSPPSIVRGSVQRSRGTADEIEEQIEVDSVPNSLKRQQDNKNYESPRLMTKEVTQDFNDKLNGDIEIALPNQTTIKKPTRKQQRISQMLSADSERRFDSKRASEADLLGDQNLVQPVEHRDGFDNHSWTSYAEKTSRRNQGDSESQSEFMKQQISKFMKWNSRQFTPPFLPKVNSKSSATPSSKRERFSSPQRYPSGVENEQSPMISVDEFISETKREAINSTGNGLKLKKTLTIRNDQNCAGTSRLSGQQPDLELIYDDILSCYYDPNSQVYYEIQQ